MFLLKADNTCVGFKTMNVFYRNVAKYVGYLHPFKIPLRSFMDFWNLPVVWVAEKSEKQQEL